jgi:hypothetical protein
MKDMEQVREKMLNEEHGQRQKEEYMFKSGRVSMLTLTDLHTLMLMHTE